MKVKLWGGLILFVLYSCGIEDIEYLQEPVLPPAVANTLLTFTYVEADYDDTNFSGFEVYYKIYPETTASGGLQNLINDQSQLALNTNNKKLYLINTLNYQRLELIPLPNTQLTVDEVLEYEQRQFEPALNLLPNLATDLDIEIDFVEYIGGQGFAEILYPKVTVKNGATTVKEFYAFRSFNFAAGKSLAFRKLLDDVSFASVPQDLTSFIAASGGSTALEGQNNVQAQMVLFVYAYGSFLGTLSESEPVALGVIPGLNISFGSN